ncbi:MAG: alpha/beta hydrolase [Pseudomonadota bacterium]
MSVFTTTDGKCIYFEDTGAGTPVLCLSGLTRNSGDFTYVAPHLSDVRVISMDSRGRGRSDYDPDYMNYNILREAQDAVELMDHLDVRQAMILGTSRGGMLAMALATRAPERLTGVVLNDVGPVIEPSGIQRIMDYVGIPPSWQTYGEAAAGLKSAMESRFPSVPLQVWHQQARIQYVEEANGLNLRYDPALRTALLEQSASGVVPDLWSYFDALRDIPTGLLRGANSDILSRATVDEMQARHPDLVFAEVPDRGHVPFLNEPQSLDVIRKVLAAT